MHLENLILTNFKNFKNLKLPLSSTVNCFIGKNGSGKTSLLDSIHYLCLTKSAFNYFEPQNIRHGSEFFQVTGGFNKDNKRTKVTCYFKKGEKKSIRLRGKAVEKHKDFIGQFPVIMIAPNDTDLIRGGSEIRRKFADGFLSQLKGSYLNILLKYHRALRQRNALLHDFEKRAYLDRDLISSYDEILIDLGKVIFQYRQELLAELIPACQENYNRLTSNKELISIDHKSDLESPDFRKFFQSKFELDLASQRTTTGIHRDDLVFRLDGFPIKKFGSQGQQKSFVLALKLAQYQLTATEKGFQPILLLDDIFDKLDDSRIGKLLEIVTKRDFGQLFVTDAGEERLPKMIRERGLNAKIFRIENQIPVLID